jgi:sulfonate transport system permease protein
MSAALALRPEHARPGRHWRLSGRAFGLVSPALFLALWWVTAAQGWFPPEILVPPAAVLSAFVEFWQTGELARHLSASFYRLWFGFGVGLIAALAFGCAVALSRTFEDYTRPLFDAVRTVPSIAFIPILILIFGIGETFKILVVVKATFFPVALATTEAVRGIAQRHFDVARAYRLPYAYRLRRVILPAALPSIVTGIRLGLGRSWGVLVAAELIASESGLGQMMEFGRQMFRLDVVMVGVVIAGVVGFSLDRIMRAIEARLSRWQAA